MFNIFEELTWPQFTQLYEITKLPLNEQVKYYNQYLYDLSLSRQNWLDTQGKGPFPPPIVVENGFLLQEDGFDILQENGFKITTTTLQ
jgi:hypothetical protein